MFSKNFLEIVCLTALLIYFIKFLLNIFKKPIPPGPIGLPFVGYLPFLTNNKHLKLTELSKKYGEIFSLKLGSQLVVVLNGTSSIRQAFVKPEFLARPPNIALLMLSDEHPLAGLELNIWQEQRSFVVQALKDLGFGRTKMTEQIQEEIHYLLKVFESHEGKPVDPVKYLGFSVSNTLSMIVLGQRYEYDHPERQVFDTRMEEVKKVYSMISFYIFFPWFKYLYFKMTFTDLKKAIKKAKSCDKLLQNKIKEHKESFDTAYVRDFIDSYLIEMEKRKEQNPDTSFTDSKLIEHIIKFFVAGTESIQTFLSWSLYIMAAYPEVQAKVQREISEILEFNRAATPEDKKAMPYTHAVLNEIMRWKTIIPLNVYRYSTTDTKLAGYIIPKYTIILANFSAVHLNKDYWKDPDHFNPERFLSKDKKSVVNSIHFMPFSIGKKSCPAEGMAKIDIFLYFVAILQKFIVKFPEGFEPTFKAELVFLYKLKPYKLCFFPRN